MDDRQSVMGRPCCLHDATSRSVVLVSEILGGLEPDLAPHVLDALLGGLRDGFGVNGTGSLLDAQTNVAYEILLEAQNNPNPQVRELAVVALAELPVPTPKRVAALAKKSSS